MKASYKLQLEQHQRRLGMSHKQLNKYDRKHNDINLINYLKSLNPVGDTGFWGTFRIDNETAYGNVPRHFNATFEINNIDIEGPIQINGDTNHIFTIPIEDRAALPTSIFKLKVTFQSGATEVDPNGMDGFDITNFTNNSLQAENTMSMIINDPNFIEEGFLRVTFTVSSDL